MIEKEKNKRKQNNYSIKDRLNLIIAVCSVPLALLVMTLMYQIMDFSGSYDDIVGKITEANAYNINFKEELDRNMYVIVVNSERASEIVNTEGPYEIIEETRDVFERLYVRATDKKTQALLDGIIRSLNTLEDRVDEIVEDAQVSGNYDLNLERLDLNIRILTELIQEQIQQYIYYEATNLEIIRDELRSDVYQAVRLGIITFVIMLLFAVIISGKIKNSITEPITELREVTKKAGSGDFEIRATVTGREDEISELADSFNHMIERIGNLVEDIRIEQLNLRATELKLLQTQINPHFLYNTLDTIVWLAENDQKEEVIMMVTTLSDFFRTTLSKGRDHIFIREEESHIRSYLQIQQFRYRDIMDYTIDIDESLGDYRILKLTLQPLVENALYHGIKNKRGKGHIHVTGRKLEGTIYLTVSDNGIGMKPERLEFLRKVIAGEVESESLTSGFGLYNVAERIQLNYGKSYGLTVESTYMEGTTVTVTIPAD